MERTPQTLNLMANTDYTLPCPVEYAPDSFGFAGWKNETDGRIYGVGDHFRAETETTLSALWRDIREYPECISLSVPKYNDGFVRHQKSAHLSKELYCGTECLKVVPMKPDEAMEDTVNLDGYRYKGAQINIDKYNYAVIIMKGGCGEMPEITFAANSGKVLTYPVRVAASTKADFGEWSAYTFDLSEVKPAMGDTWDYCLWQLYIHPYGGKTLQEISGNDAVYLAKLMFFVYNPGIGTETKMLSECFNDKDISKALIYDGVKPDFEDTEITYITSNGKFAAILTDTANLCNINLKPDFEAGERFVRETDVKCRKRIAEIRNTKTAVKVKGTKYYVSNDGCDENDGLTENTPWKTADRVNTAELNAGDGVFFRRGDIWHGVMINAQEGVTYSAYGEGEKPKLYGSPENGADASKWTLYSEVDGKKVWLYHIETYDVGLIVFDDEKYTTKAIPSFIGGKFVQRDNPEKDFDVKSDLCDNLMLFSEVFPSGAWVSKNKGKLYLRCDAGNPGEIFRSIEFNTRPCIIECGSKPGVTVDNLCLKHSGTIAVHAWDGTEKILRPVKNLTVKNCEVGWIGGGIQFYATAGVNAGRVTRLGNGIEIYGGCENYTIDNCYIYQCYDAGLTIQCGGSSNNAFQEMNNVSFTNNIIDYCIYGMEIWNGNSDKILEGRTGENINVSGHIIRYCGDGFGNQRPNPGTAAAIMGFYHENVFKNYTVKNNIFIKSIDNLLHFTSEYKDTLPKCEGNTYVQAKGLKLGYCGAKAGIRYDFDMTAETTINNVFGDKKAKIYYINK